MGRRARNVLLVGVALALVAALGWRWLAAREDVPERSDYRIDLDVLRKVAASLPGPGPREIRSQLVAEVGMPRGVVFAGEPLSEPLLQVHQVFQLVWAERRVLVDVAFPPAAFERMGVFGADGQSSYDAEAFEQVRRAFQGAESIVITHEHFDHLAGASVLPVEEAWRLRLNPAQLANAEALEQSEIPAALREGLEPLEAAPLVALAPGVVLLAAPGHTPGSQIVYVRRADGREALLLGDVAWNADQIQNLHYRPRLVTLLLGENRAQVMAQLRTLHDLAAAVPEVAQVVSHDRRQRAALLADGLLVEGLAP